MREHARHEVAGDGREPVIAGRIVHGRLASPVAKAEMDVDAAAGAVRIEDRRESGAVPEPERRGARHLAQLDRVVRRLHPERGRAGHLVLAGAIFRQEGIRLDPCPAHRRHQALRQRCPGGDRRRGYRARPAAARRRHRPARARRRRRAAGRPPPRAPPGRGAGNPADSTPRASRRSGGCRPETSARRRRRRRNRRSPR